MKNAMIAAAGFVILALAAFAAAPAAKATKSATAVAPATTHGQELNGTITSVNDKAKTFVIKDAAGKATTVTWTAATRVEGGVLKASEMATVRAMPKDGKTIATSVKIAPVVAAKPAPKAAPAPAAKPAVHASAAAVKH